MKVVKTTQARESYVNGASGTITGVYAAVTDEGEVIAYFRPGGLQGGMSRSSCTIKDASGKRLLGGPEPYKLADFRKWAREGLPGAYVRLV